MATPQWPAVDYDDNQLSESGAAIGVPIFSSPIPLTTAKYVFTQDWQGDPDYPAVKLNTAHPSAGQTPDYSSYVLVEEGDRQLVGANQVRWTRTYAQVPASYSLFEYVPYSFIGTLNAIGSPPTNISRDRQNWSLQSRIQHDYFLTPNPGDTPLSIVDPITGDSVSLASAGDIERIQDMIYCFQNTLNGGAIYGGIQMATNILNPALSSVPTWPSSDQYQSMIADALANGWKSTASKIVLFPTETLGGGTPFSTGHMAGVVDTTHSVLGGQIPIECRLDLWRGNIWLRRTRYVLAR